MSTAALDRRTLAAAFRELGLEPGDGVIVHSSFRSLRPVDGGPEAVIDALLDAVGERGNLMLPTFNYTTPLPEPYYDADATPCRTGIIPELGRRRPGAVRSLHPTHSVAVIGPDADALTRDHLSVRAIGAGSPIDRLAKAGGKVLLVGVGHISNSTVHVAEEYAAIPKVSWYDPLPDVKMRMPDGRVVLHPLDASPSCSAAFGAAEHALRRRGRIRDLRIGPARCQLMTGRDVIELVGEIIEEKPDVLLCTWLACRPCTGARAGLRRQGRLPAP